jgi:hypothetical protein
MNRWKKNKWFILSSLQFVVQEIWTVRFANMSSAQYNRSHFCGYFFLSTKCSVGKLIIKICQFRWTREHKGGYFTPCRSRYVSRSIFFNFSTFFAPNWFSIFFAPNWEPFHRKTNMNNSGEGQRFWKSLTKAGCLLSSFLFFL